MFGAGKVDPFLALGLRVRDRRLPANTLVFGLEPNSEAAAVAIPVEVLMARGGLMQLEHGDAPLVVLAVDPMRVTACRSRVDLRRTCVDRASAGPIGG